MLRDLLTMDIAYLHLRNVKWKAVQPAHLGGDNVRASDDNESQSVVPLRDDYNFVEWDFTNDIGKIPWSELTYSLTGGKVLDLDKVDLPHYLLPALCIASAAISRGKRLSEKIPEELSKFYERCQGAVQGGTAENLDGFLDFEVSDPPGQSWKRRARGRDYTEAELDYIAAVWESARAEYKQSSRANTPPAGSPAEPAETTEDADSTAAGDEAAKRTLRSRDPAAAPNPAPANVPTKGGRVKQNAFVKTVTKPAQAGHLGSRTPKRKNPPAAAAPDAPAPAVPKKLGRKRSVGSPSIPISEKTSRALLGQNELNQRFPKSYISPFAPKKSPVPNLTLGKAWHVVSALNHTLSSIISRF